MACRWFLNRNLFTNYRLNKMEISYTKSKPKVADYNPLTHNSFYSEISATSAFSPQFKKNNPYKPYSFSPEYTRSTSLANRNIFSHLSHYENKSNSIEETSNSKQDSPRYYKTRPKNQILDPISGEVKKFNINRPKLENLDVFNQKDKLSNDLNLSSIQDFQAKKSLLKSVDNIAGSLKKEVPFLPYVNPFILRTSLSNN